VCCLSQSAQFTGGISKKYSATSKGIDRTGFFSRGFPREFLFKKRFFSRNLQVEYYYFRLIVCGFPRILLPAILLQS
jgi:hypothetical protein